MQSHAFSDLGLSQPLVDAVAANGYVTPTQIQKQAIPALLSGTNVLGTAQTGTGKTAAFTLPLLQTLMHDTPRRKGNDSSQDSAGNDARGGSRGATRRNARRSIPTTAAKPRALVVAPTRELAIQIDESVKTYGARSGITSLAIFGGAPKATQEKRLRGNPDILVATPGRLLDFIGENHIDISSVAFVVLDEADRMLDMGFIHDVRKIVAMAEARRQTALFSATMPKEVEHLAKEVLGSSFTRVAVAAKEITADGIKQSVLHMAREDKVGMLPELIKDRGMFRVLVFTRTKHRAARLAKQLSKAGIPSAEIHGNRTQNQRQRALESFRNGRAQVLVGTDVAARGIDVDDITHVINYEIPNEPETYVHRIGRTARAGSVGEALSMCDVEELDDFRRIERFVNAQIDIDRSHRAHREPTPAKRGGPRRGQSRTGGQSRTNGTSRTNGASSQGRSGSGGGTSRGKNAGRRGKRAARPNSRG